MRLKLRIGQKNMSVFALIVRWLWKHFRLPRHLLWYVSASRHWMISLPGMPWGYIGSLVMPEWEGIKLLTGSQGAVLVSGLLGLSPVWGSLGRQYGGRWNAGWRISIWHCGKVPVVHRGRLKSWSLAPIWKQGPDYCPSIGHKPGLLLVCSPDVTPWEDIYM